MNIPNELAATHLTEHLSEDQFSDYVIGLSTEDMDLHVEQCASCRAEVLRVQDAVSMFAEAGREWSTLQPAVLPAAEAARSIRRRSMWLTLRPVAGFAVAAVAVFSVSFSAHRTPAATSHVAIDVGIDAPHQTLAHTPIVPQTVSPARTATPAYTAHSEAAPVESAAPIAETALPESMTAARIARRAPVTSEVEVAQDNALMAAIDAEITSPYNVAADVSRPFPEQ